MPHSPRRTVAADVEVDQVGEHAVVSAAADQLVGLLGPEPWPPRTE